MRRRLLILSAALLVLIGVLSGCKKAEKDPNVVTNFLKDLKGYSTEFTIDIKNDKQTITYEGKQYFNKGQGYRVELGQDRIFIYKSDKIYVNDVKNNFKYTLGKDFDNLYTISFVNNYVNLLYTNEEIKYDFKEIEGRKYQLIELIMPGGNVEISKAVMYVETKTCIPQRILVYDYKGNERIKINYKNFQANPEMNLELFKVD